MWLCKLFICFFNGYIVIVIFPKIVWISDPELLPENGPLSLHPEDSEEVVLYAGFGGTSSDFLALAHEYGHTLQILQSNSVFIPKIDREVAAFLAEHIFLACLRSIDSHSHKSIRRIWQAETKKYEGCAGEGRVLQL